MKHQTQLSISFGGIRLLFMQDCAPFVVLGNWALLVPFLWVRFCIFDRLVLDEFVS
jgi:hypothetical protein